jgi:hypothetical protein
MGKDCVEIAASATMLLDAHKHIKEYPSSAEDTGTFDRLAKHFCQHVINTGNMELEALQAAGVVLNADSSGSSDSIQFYSGWEVLRLARIAENGHACDIDFSNEVLNNNATPLYATDSEGEDDGAMELAGADSTVDLLDKFHTTCGDSSEGYAKVYRTTQNENVPVSTAHHYMHRDSKLWRFNAYEFARLFNVRAMTNNDEKWFKEATATPQQISTRRGRNCDRFLLMPPHPLHTSHILVPRAKLGIPAFAGTPPPSDTASEIINASITRKRRRYADFFVSNFIPWSATHPPILSYSTWIDHVNILEMEACQRSQREPDILPTTSQNEKLAIKSARRSRLIASGRLYDIENCTKCFKTKKEAVVLLGKYRARARAVWNQNGDYKPYDGTAAAQNKEASILVQKLRDKADRMTCPQDIITRQNDAKWASEWTKDLGIALRTSQDHRTTINGPVSRLHYVWKQAANPLKRSLAGGIRCPREVAQLLKQPIVLDDRDDWFTSTSTPTIANPSCEPSIASDPDKDPFEAITDIEYETAVDIHKRLGLEAKTAPLNLEQRACGRDFLKIAMLRKQRKAQGCSPIEIRDEIRRLGLHQVTMMIGELYLLSLSLLPP